MTYLTGGHSGGGYELVYRAFLDANILWSASYGERPGVGRLWRFEDVELYSSQYAVEEARRNLIASEQSARLRELLSRVTVSPVATPPAPLFRESHGLPEKDQPILWAAIDVQATHLITGDERHFGHLYGKTVEGVTVIRARDFMRLCKARPPAKRSRGSKSD